MVARHKFKPKNDFTQGVRARRRAERKIVRGNVTHESVRATSIWARVAITNAQRERVSGELVCGNARGAVSCADLAQVHER